MHWVTVLKAVRASYAVKIWRWLSDPQVLILVLLLVSSITEWTNIAVTMPWSVGTSKTVVLLSTETESQKSTPTGLETVLKFIPVTFVRIKAFKIWWIIHLTFFTLIIIIAETSASWNKSQVTNWCKATDCLDWTPEQEIVSYPVPEQQSTQVAFVIWCVPWEWNKISQQEVSSIYSMYTVYHHDAVHIWLHGCTEKSPWYLCVRNDIKLHIQFSCPFDAWALCMRTHFNPCELSIISPKMV